MLPGHVILTPYWQPFNGPHVSAMATITSYLIFDSSQMSGATSMHQRPLRFFSARRFLISFCAMVVLSLASSPHSTHAEVTAKGETGFQIRIETNISASSEQVYKALTDEIDQWWSSAHTYTGDAKNLYLEPEAKGWFGERLANGGTCCHLQVVFVQPGQTLRLSGGLGPLQEMGVHGALTVQLVGTGTGTQVVLTYNVSGFAESGLAPIAAPVDGVLTEQMNRLKAHVEQ